MKGEKKRKMGGSAVWAASFATRRQVKMMSTPVVCCSFPEPEVSR